MIRHVLYMVLASLAFTACSPTKYMTEGEVLYTGMAPFKIDQVEYGGEGPKINYYGRKISNSYLFAWNYPNGSIVWPLYTPVHPGLWAYNIFYTEKDKGFSRWMMVNFGKAPRTISSVDPELIVKKVENFWFNLGHFDISGEYDLKYKRNYSRAWITYRFRIPSAYTIRDVSVLQDERFPVLTQDMQKVLNEDKSLEGTDFNLFELEGQKDYLHTRLSDEGYFYLRKYHIVIQVDTTVGKRQVDVRYSLARGLPASTSMRALVSNHITFIDTLSSLTLEDTVINAGKMRVTDIVLDKSLLIRDSTYYSYTDRRNTIRHLNQLGIFNEVLINYLPLPNDSSWLVSEVRTRTAKPMNIDTDIRFTAKNTGFIGPSVGATYSHANLLGGAQKFTLGGEVFKDIPTGVNSERIPSTFGFRLFTEIRSFVFLTIANREELPFPERTFSADYEYTRRTDRLSIQNLSLDYHISWESRNNIKQQVTPVMIDYFLAENPDQITLAQIDSLKGFILGGAYSFSIDKPQSDLGRFSYSFDLDLEIAGNMIGTIAPKLDGEVDANFLEKYPFSQYIRVNSDLRLYWELAYRTQLVFRNNIGIAKSYGFSEKMPLIKLFYIGGSNSLRPLAARSAGPGAYYSPDATYQVGDLKFESNLELRFPLGLRLNGALWTDVGNIWLLDDEQPDTGFSFNGLPDNIFMTGGVGFRFDTDFVVARLDAGLVLNKPAAVELENNWGFVFGIGYPF